MACLLNMVKNEGCRGGVQARFRIQKEQGQECKMDQ
jgi:hypothetical protein